MPRLHRRALADLLEPALEVRELVDVLALRLPADRPRIADHVGDRVFVTGDVAAPIQPVVQDPVQPVGFVGETRHGIALIAPSVAEPAEMPAFAELRSLVGHLPDDPLRDLVLAAQILRPEAARLLGEVHHDRAGFENRDRFAAARRVVVDNDRHAMVRVHREKLGLELVASAGYCTGRSCRAERIPRAGSSPSCRSASARNADRSSRFPIRSGARAPRLIVRASLSQGTLAQPFPVWLRRDDNSDYHE